MLLTLFHEDVSDVEFIPQISTLLYLISNQRILWEYVFLQELFRKGVCTDFADGHVDEFGFFVEAHIIITYERVFLKFDSKMMLLFLR